MVVHYLTWVLGTKLGLQKSSRCCQSLAHLSRPSTVFLLMGNSFHRLSPSPGALLQNFPPVMVYPGTLFTLSFVKLKLLCLTKFNTSTFPSQMSVWVAYLRHSAQAKIMKRASSLGSLFPWTSELHLKLIPICYVKRDFFFNVVT